MLGRASIAHQRERLCGIVSMWLGVVCASRGVGGVTEDRDTCSAHQPVHPFAHESLLRRRRRRIAASGQTGGVRRGIRKQELASEQQMGVAMPSASAPATRAWLGQTCRARTTHGESLLRAGACANPSS